MIGIDLFAGVHNLDLRQSMTYNRFKDTLAERLGDYLKSSGIVRQRPSLSALQEMEGGAIAPGRAALAMLALLAHLDESASRRGRRMWGWRCSVAAALAMSMVARLRGCAVTRLRIPLRHRATS